MLEPMSVQSPFAAGRNQPVADQRLQDVQPARSFARRRQRRQPKLVQSQLIPQKSRHPAGTPLTRPTQPHGAQPDRHHIAIEDRRKTILGKQRDLFGLPSAFIEDLDRLAPRHSLAVVDLSKIKYLPLNHAAIINAPVFDNRPCAMFLAVLAANLGAQKHDADSRLAHGRARSLVGTTGGCANLGASKPRACRDQTPRKSQKSRPVGEVGIGPSPTCRRQCYRANHGSDGGIGADVRCRQDAKIVARTSAPKTSASKNIISLKVTLRGVKPPVWRRLLVPGTMTLGDLHKAIQAAMGWRDCHLHAFDIGGEQFVDRRSVDDVVDENRPTLNGLLRSSVVRFAYTYDFGDNWEHTIAFEKSEPAVEEQSYPVCIAGKRNCPPEDCGGVWGYEELLAILADPAHPEHAEQIDWTGEEFKPDEFDLERANTVLAARFRKK